MHWGMGCCLRKFVYKERMASRLSTPSIHIILRYWGYMSVSDELRKLWFATEQSEGFRAAKLGEKRALGIIAHVQAPKYCLKSLKSYSWSASDADLQLWSWGFHNLPKWFLTSPSQTSPFILLWMTPYIVLFLSRTLLKLVCAPVLGCRFRWKLSI